MVFTRRLRDGIRRGLIRVSIRVWQRPHAKVGGKYAMDDGYVVVDSIDEIDREDISEALARESGFASVDDLMATARHGAGAHIYLVRFHYLPPGGWDMARPARGSRPRLARS